MHRSRRKKMKNQEIRRIKIKNSFIFRLIIPSALYFKKDFFHSKLGLMRTGETGGKIDDEKRRHKIKFQEKITEILSENLLTFHF